MTEAAARGGPAEEVGLLEPDLRALAPLIAVAVHEGSESPLARRAAAPVTVVTGAAGVVVWRLVLGFSGPG